jgi:hypothetical protein
MMRKFTPTGFDILQPVQGQETADLGWVHDTILAIGPIEPPLVGFRLVHTQGQTFDVACWAIDRVQFGAAIPNLEADSSTV